MFVQAVIMSTKRPTARARADVRWVRNKPAQPAEGRLNLFEYIKNDPPKRVVPVSNI